MSFKVPDMEYSSSPAPSTPARKESNLFSFSASNNPTTTPAGPPPSSANSFTPAGPPPTSFGSSMFSNNTPSKPMNFNPHSPSPLKFGNPGSSPPREFTNSTADFEVSVLGSKYNATPRRGFRPPSVDEDDEDEDEGSEEGIEVMEEVADYVDGYVDEETMEEHDDMYDDEEDMGDRPEYDQQSASDQASNEEDFGRSMLNLKESMGRPGTNGQGTIVYSVAAKELYTQIEPPDVTESDELVLKTEDLVAQLYKESVDDETTLEALTFIPEEFIKLWNGYQKQTAIYELQEYTARIGPGPRTSAFTKADFLADLVLHIYHPQAEMKDYARRLKPLPETMLNWLNKHHNPYPSQFAEIQTHRPSPANHSLFWDMIFNNLLRGKLSAVVSIMKNGGWRHARGGNDDLRSQNGQVGYSGVALSNVERVIALATDVLSQCPAYRGDWDTRNGDWTLFRIKASQALDDLKRFAEGKDYDQGESLRSSSGLASKSNTYSKTAKKAQSLVPWFVYQRLISLYNFIMGDRDEILSNAQDWCEAAFGLFIWWDEGREDRQLALGKSRNDYRAASRESDSEAYLQKLRKSFVTATAEETELHVNTSDPVEVGLASALEGDSESVIGFLRAWSGPVSSAVAEIGSLGGWLPQSEPQNLMRMSLDEQDMMVLGLNSSPSKSDSIKDKTLIAYSKALSHRGALKSSSVDGSVIIEGWELSISVLGRLDSAARSEEMVGEFLKGFKLDSPETVDKLWKLLNGIGMTAQAENTAETYANHLAEETHQYGEALWYYALSHKSKKVKDVLDLLISYSLVQSIAYPPEAELDNHLRRLVSSPKSALVEMSQLDVDAAELLHTMLSGYATLRRFYVLRDEEIVYPKGGKPLSGSRARKSQAIAALMTVIVSSDDNIRGGLYDEDRGAVVSVDFLLALLGEVLVFVNQPGHSLSVSDIDTLLKTIEDLQAVGPRVYSACTEFLQTVLASTSGLKTPADLLRKSTSNLSGTSSFSMVGSSMLASQLKQSMGSSGVLVKGNIKRGWDWRENLPAGITGETLLRMLRHGLAHKLADSWLAEVDNLL